VFRGKLKYLVSWKGTALRKANGDQQRMSRAPEDLYLSSTGETWKHLSIYPPSIFANLHFHPITNLTHTPDKVPLGWSIGLCTLGHIAFEGGVNVRIFPL